MRRGRESRNVEIILDSAPCLPTRLDRPRFARWPGSRTHRLITRFRPAHRTVTLIADEHELDVEIAIADELAPAAVLPVGAPAPNPRDPPVENHDVALTVMFPAMTDSTRPATVAGGRFRERASVDSACAPSSHH